MAIEKDLVAVATIHVEAAPANVWRALTEPALIKQYLFGTDVESDWKTGSSIVYRGVWEGKAYEDKGEILQMEPERLLVSTHWSPLSGLADHPNNYHRVSYLLEPAGDGTNVTIRQDNNATDQEKSHSEENWRAVLDGLKRLVEAM